MRVALAYDVRTGGSPRMMLSVGRVLADRGHSVLACGPVSSHRAWAGIAARHGVELVDQPRRGALALPGPVRKQIKAFRPEVLVSSHRGCDVRSSALARTLGVPHVIRVAADPTNRHIDQQGRLTFLTLRNWLWRAAFDRAAKVFCPSLFIVEALAAFGIDRRKIECIPNAVDLGEFAPQRARPFASRRGPTRLLAVGNLDYGKRPLLMVELVSRLADMGVNVVATWVGDGPLRDDVSALASRLAVGDAIELVGFDPQPVRHYQQADVLVHLCTFEGFGLVLAEAQACGLPVVAFRAGGVPEVVEDGKTGILCDPLDVEQAALATKRLATEPGTYAAMSRAAVERAKRCFTFERLGVDCEKMLLCSIKVRNDGSA